MSMENEISYDIRGAIFKVYNELGPGLLEIVYEKALKYELMQLGRRVLEQIELPVIYKGMNLNYTFRMDLLVDDLVIVEIKAVENLAPVFFKQLLTYLRLSGKKLGILVNFNTDEIEKNIFRVVNNL